MKLLFVFCFVFLIIIPVAYGSVQIDLQTFLQINNSNINFSSTKTFDNIDVGSNYINFTGTGFFSIIPSDTVNYINITIITWNTTGDYHKIFTASSNTHINPTTFTIGDFPSNKIITIYVDGIESAQTNSNDSGYMSFTYVGLYSAHQFDVLIQGVASSPETAAQLNILVGLIKISVFIGIVYILLNYFIFKSSQKTSMDKESLMTKIVILTLASIFALVIVLALGSMTGF